MSGFKLNKLVVTGGSQEPAAIDFKPGLNVISGGSDTGKTWLFQCLSFMLGGTESPAEIKEAKPYNFAWLEVEDYDGVSYTLCRSLSGGDARLFSKPYDGIELGDEPRILKHKTPSKESPQTIAMFFQELCGFPEAKIVTNKDNKKEGLSFRTLRALFLAQEEEIIQKHSPVMVDAFSRGNKAWSILKFVLTGQDDSEVKTAPDKKLIKAGKDGQILVLDSLIDTVQAQLEKLPDVQLDELDESTRLTDLSLIRALAQLNGYDETRRVLISSITEKEAKVLNMNELQDRFGILRTHYQSDINRLSFIAEGALLFDELQFVECPYCQTPLSNHDLKRACEENEVPVGLVQLACQREKEKAIRQLEELQAALKTVAEERSGLEASVATLNEQYAEVVNTISLGLTPQIQRLRQDLEHSLNQRSQAIERELLLKQLAQYNNLKETFAVNSPQSADIREARTLNAFALQSFCKEVEELLQDWGVEFNPPVTFDEDMKVLDIVLGGEPRANTGKGTRAITYSSFMLGLLRHCENHNLPHSRLIILDSPLTTFEDGEKASGVEEIPEVVQHNFFTKIASGFANSQVVIVENKVPPAELQGSINFIKFTKNLNMGRYGFFPK